MPVGYTLSFAQILTYKLLVKTRVAITNKMERKKGRHNINGAFFFSNLSAYFVTQTQLLILQKKRTNVATLIGKHFFVTHLSNTQLLFN